MTKLLLGTYTKRESEGIYQIGFDETSKTLSNLELIAKVQNPTYLDYDSIAKQIVSVAQKGSLAGISVFEYDGQSARELYDQMEEGVPPCYVAFDPQEPLIYEANYHKGKVKVTHNQHVDKVIEFGEGSKAHFMDTDPKTGDVFVCDLGGDGVHKYTLLNEVATYYTPKGTGPRHIAFHPTKPIVYVFGELNSTITVLRDEGFELVHIQTLSTLPTPSDKNWGAAIRISNDGKFVYASNRADSTISVFKVEDDATLTLIQNISTFGDHPRDFDLSHDNKFLVCANMNTDNLTVYERAASTGELTMVQANVYAPEVVCVKFI